MTVQLINGVEPGVETQLIIFMSIVYQLPRVGVQTFFLTIGTIASSHLSHGINTLFRSGELGNMIPFKTKKKTKTKRSEIYIEVQGHFI